jgi:hypothetical protein
MEDGLARHQDYRVTRLHRLFTLKEGVMNRSLAVFATILVIPICALSELARAEEGMTAEHKSVGIGFHSTDAPLGVRWWLSGQKIAIDLGVGFGSDEAFNGYPDESVSNWAVDAGVPIVLKTWPRVHVLFRPGILYESHEVVISDGPPPPAGEPFDTDSETDLFITAEIEGEAFLLENFSVSASTGISYRSHKPADFDPTDGLEPETETSFSTIGNNFTNIGFHLYMFR